MRGEEGGARAVGGRIAAIPDKGTRRASEASGATRTGRVFRVFLLPGFTCSGGGGRPAQQAQAPGCN